MDAAFDAPPDMDDDENSGLLSRQQEPERRADRIPGDYDFERDYVSLPLPPSNKLLVLYANCYRLCRQIHRHHSRTTLLITQLRVIRTASSRQMPQPVRHPRVVISSEASCHRLSCLGNNHRPRMGG